MLCSSYRSKEVYEVRIYNKVVKFDVESVLKHRLRKKRQLTPSRKHDCNQCLVVTTRDSTSTEEGSRRRASISQNHASGRPRRRYFNSNYIATDAKNPSTKYMDFEIPSPPALTLRILLETSRDLLRTEYNLHVLTGTITEETKRCYAVVGDVPFYVSNQLHSLSSAIPLNALLKSGHNANNVTHATTNRLPVDRSMVMLHKLNFLIILFILLSLPRSVVSDSGFLEAENSSNTNTTDFNDNTYEYKLFENYFPLLLMLISMPQNETESLEKYLNQRTYAELKRMIDEKQKASDVTSFVLELEQNNTDLTSFAAVDNNKKFISLVEAYHNASIYNAIRGVWNSQLNPVLPPIDQLAILEYFAERRSYEHYRVSFWARLWAAIRAWLAGNQELIGCNADQPRCIRHIIEKLPMEGRIELDKAAGADDTETVDYIITQELNNEPPSTRHEFLVWKNQNIPPQPLLDIIESTTEVEKR
uniref:Reverse transcriptase domain-containing protein n=1 Tax=Heterorhabditis bacteriophora TaxID=37862 RepID=A0A1I7WC86_HETBA